MGSAPEALPAGSASGTEFPQSAASISGASGKPRSTGAAAPTMALAPRLRRRFLREMDIALLLYAIAPVSIRHARRKIHRTGRHEAHWIVRGMRTTPAPADILLFCATERLGLPAACASSRHWWPRWSG